MNKNVPVDPAAQERIDRAYPLERDHEGELHKLVDQLQDAIDEIGDLFTEEMIELDARAGHPALAAREALESALAFLRRMEKNDE
jgi:hypothetical protein